MLVTYPDRPANKHICGTVADTPTCIHNALHQLGSIAPFREHCTSSEGVSCSLSGVTPQRNKNFRGRTIRNSHQTGGFARHEPPTRRRRMLPGPHVVQNPHCPQLKPLQRASQITTRYTLALQTEDREYQETGLHPLVVQSPHRSPADEHKCEESGLRCPTIWIG